MFICNTVAYVTINYDNMCITHKCNLRTDWEFGNKLILTLPTGLCHTNTMLGSQNGPLTVIIHRISMEDVSQKCVQTSPHLVQWFLRQPAVLS